MNIPTYQEKSYNFIPQAAIGLTQGLGAAFDIGEKERKRALVDEQLKQIKIDQKTVEKVRDQAIVEAASKIHEAYGLPDDESGYGRAHDIAISLYYQPLGEERNNPSMAIKRLHTQETEELPKIINKAKMDRYRNETSQQQTQVEAERLGKVQPPQGSVGVGPVQGIQRTQAGPSSITDVQQSVLDQQMREPQAAPAINREATAQERYETARAMGIENDPAIQKDIGFAGRMETVQDEYPAGTTQEQVTRDYLQKPVVTPEMKTYAETYPSQKKTDEEKYKLDILKQRLKNLKQQGANKAAGDVDKNIRWATDRVDDLEAGIIKNNEKINRLRQARVRLMANQKLSPSLSQMLQGVVSNPENPDLNEINQQINAIQDMVNSSVEAKKDAESIVNDLSKGKSLTQASGAKQEKASQLAQEAYNHIQTEIKKVSSQFTTTEQILNMLPSEYKKVMREKVEAMRGRGVPDEKIADMLLGR